MRSRDVFHETGMLLAIVTMVACLSGCGKDTTAPSDATLTIFPTEIKASIAAPTCFTSTVIVLFKDGTPMNKAELAISGAFAYPRQGGGDRYHFYDGPCIFPLDPLKARDSGFSGVTDAHGAYTFGVYVSSATVTFSDSIEVRSGAVGATQKIEIQ